MREKNVSLSVYKCNAKKKYKEGRIVKGKITLECIRSFPLKRNLQSQVNCWQGVEMERLTIRILTLVRRDAEAN